LVVQRHYSKIPIAEFRNHGPESIAVVFLAFNAERLLDDRDTPLTTKIRSLAEHFALKILREAILGHGGNLPRLHPPEPRVDTKTCVAEAEKPFGN
jgi:hypothetical protein